LHSIFSVFLFYFILFCIYFAWLIDRWLAHKFFKLAPFYCAHSHTLLLFSAGLGFLLRRLQSAAAHARGPQKMQEKKYRKPPRNTATEPAPPGGARSFGKLLTLAGCTTY